MSRDDLTVRQRAVLFALLSKARPVPNPELKELIGVPLNGEDRRGLNERKLVESTKLGRAFAHELTDKGWQWCNKELAAAPGERATSLERAHYLVFGVLARYLDAAKLTLADIVDANDTAARIEGGYRSLAAGAGEFVRLRELRLRLADVARADLDSALVALFTAQRINLIPQENQQALTDADHESALRIGGENKHLISIE